MHKLTLTDGALHVTHDQTVLVIQELHAYLCHLSGVEGAAEEDRQQLLSNALLPHAMTFHRFILGEHWQTVAAAYLSTGPSATNNLHDNGKLWWCVLCEPSKARGIHMLRL